MSASVRSTAQKLVQKSLSSVLSGGASPAISGLGIVNKIAGKISKETLGYDFPGLLVKILIFYVFALIADAIMSAIITGSGIIVTISTILGKKIPNFLPQQIVDFYTNGYKGIKYWDVVNAGIMALIAFEAWNYIKSNEATGGKPSSFTLGIFVMIEATLALIFIPSLYQRLKDIQAFGTSIPETKTTNAPPNIGPQWLPTGYSYLLGTDGNYYAMVGNYWQMAIKDSATSGHLSGINLTGVP